jgi:adenylate kinase
MLNLVIFGPPGCGKGTQSARLVNKYGIVHLSTGDLLRSEIKEGTALGLEAKKLMDQGLLVPDEVVIAMIRSRIEGNPDAGGFIFDGFPRTEAQARALDRLLEEKGTSILATLSLEVERDELVRRILGRGEDSGRADDQDPAIIGKRIEEYSRKTAPLIEYYKQQGKYKPVVGQGTIEQIFDKLCHLVDQAVS